MEKLEDICSWKESYNHEHNLVKKGIINKKALQSYKQHGCDKCDGQNNCSFYMDSNFMENKYGK